MTHHLSRLLAGALLVLAVAAVPASAAPVTVQLRVEGPTSTIFDGTVTTDVQRFHFSGDSTTYQCDGVISSDPNQDNPNPEPRPTRGAAMVAAQSQGLTMTGTYGGWGVTFATVGGQSVGWDGARYLTEYKNGAFSDLGACADPIANGDRLLFAFAAYGDIALSLTAPVNANVGETVPFVVRNAANNVGQAGATVGTATSNADGVAHMTFPGVGRYTFKAEKAGAVRSNAVTVCVHDGNDGNCGYPLDPGTSAAPPAAAPAPEPVPASPASLTADTAAPLATIGSITSRQRFAKGKGPRALRGTISDASGVQQVELRLRRQAGKRCFSYDGDRERFARISCRAEAAWFSVGSASSWSYLLPKRLASGLYQLQVRATDTAGNPSAVQSLRFRVA